MSLRKFSSCHYFLNSLEILWLRSIDIRLSQETMLICLPHEISEKNYNRFSGNVRKCSTTRSHVEGCASVFLSQFRNISPAVTISRTKMDRGTWNMVIRLIMHSISPASACAPRDAPRSLAAIRSNRHWNLKRVSVFREMFRYCHGGLSPAAGTTVFFTAVSHLLRDLNHQDLKICSIIFLGSER